MDQIKIGKFIAERRKAVGLTQLQLAEMLSITDRAVSKWENGRSLPDSSLMLALCKTLGISVNDLLNGEVVTMEQYEKQQEKTVLELLKQKEEADRHLLHLEVVIACLSVFILLSMTMLASYLPMQDWLRVVLIILGFVPCLIGLGYALRLEQVAGYYECGKCGHRYVPTYKSVLWAMHAGRTRYMKCPECHKKSWQKKVISKSKEQE